MSASALAARFANTASWLSVFLASYIGALAFELNQFCVNDPPAVPVLNAADFVDLVQLLNPSARAAAQAKIQAWVGSQVWWDYCECATPPTPAPPVPQAPPSGLAQIDPPTVYGVPPVAPCRHVGSASFSMGGGSALTITDLAPIQTLETFVVYTLTVTPAGTRHPTVNFTIRTEIATDPETYLTYQIVPVVSGASITSSLTLPANRDNYDVLVATVGAAASDDSVSFTADFYCNGQLPGQLVNGCCPPPAGLQAQIDQILQTVTLIQRQNVPFAYVPGAVHAGLSGAGTIAISGLLGCKIVLTTTPGALGQAGTSPLEIFGAGFVTFGTADGYPTSYRVEHPSMLLLPVRCSAYTAIAYDLAPGVVLTLTELVREP